MLALMPSDLTPIDALALEIASLAPRSRVVPLISDDVTWIARSKPFPAAIAALARLRAEVAIVTALQREPGIVVDVAGLARISVGTSGRYTGVVVLLALAGHPSRVVLLPVE